MDATALTACWTPDRGDTADPGEAMDRGEKTDCGDAADCDESAGSPASAGKAGTTLDAVAANAPTNGSCVVKADPAG